LGITRGTSSAHIARAALESIAFQTYDVLKAMEADSGIEIKELRVDGGATANGFLMQFQSDLLQSTIVKPETTEITALGAAYLAGLGIGVWDDVEQIKEQWKIQTAYRPQPHFEVGEKVGQWKRAVDAVAHWSNNQ